MPTFYRGSDAVITHKAITVWAPHPHTLRISELRDVYVIRGDCHPSRLVASHATGGAAAMVLAAWPLLETPAAWAVALGLVAVSGAASAGCSRVYPRVQELRAIYFDLDVLVYASSDRTTFGQVRRALVRALEYARERREWTCE